MRRGCWHKRCIQGFLMKQEGKADWGGGALHLTSSNLGSGHRVSPTYTACCSLRLFSGVLPDKGWHFSPREAPVTWPWLRLQDKRRRHESIIITCHLHGRCTTFRQTQQLCEKEQVCKCCYLNECEVNNTSGPEQESILLENNHVSFSIFPSAPCCDLLKHPAIRIWWPLH